MTYYHVRITPKNQQHNDEAITDLSSEDLERRIIARYRQGKPITVNGRTFDLDDVERIRIAETSEESAILIKAIESEDDNTGFIDLLPTSWRIFDRAKDVTNHLIVGPPGRESVSDSEDVQESRPTADTKTVFVVHGRNEKAREALFTFLRSMGLDPLEWSKAVKATGKTTPYIGEILNAAFDRAHAIVVLFTPDDEARLLQAFSNPNDPTHETELTGQARPNVLFEAGMAMGRSEERTVFVELGRLRPFSDVAGRHLIKLDNTPQSRHQLALRLQSAGCPANLDGTDWHKAGDFEAALSMSETSIISPLPSARNEAESPKKIVLTEHCGGHKVLPPELAEQIPLDPRIPESSDDVWLSKDGKTLHVNDNVYEVCSTQEEARERSREVGVRTAWFDENFTYTSSSGENPARKLGLGWEKARKRTLILALERWAMSKTDSDEVRTEKKVFTNRWARARRFPRRAL